ncbi:MAG TPA: carboxymuconolactone decarboxylase family protein [Anaeromyxobacter sp.]
MRRAKLLSTGTVAALAIAALLPPLARADDPAKPAPGSLSRSGLPYVNEDAVEPKELVETIRARRGGKLLNLDRILLHSPNYAKGWNGMFAAIRNQLSLPAKLRETAIMAIGVLNDAEYEWVQHEKEYLSAGGTQAQLARMKDMAAAMKDAKLFDEAERATLALTSEMTRNVKVKPATLKRIRAVLPDAQVVELIGTIAGYNMVSRFVVATGVEVEKPVAAAAK